MNLSRMVTIVTASRSISPEALGLHLALAAGQAHAPETVLVYRRRRGSIDLSPPLFAAVPTHGENGRTFPGDERCAPIVAWGPSWRGVMAHAQAEADRLRDSAADVLESMGLDLAALYLADCCGLYGEPQAPPCEECGGAGIVWEQDIAVPCDTCAVYQPVCDEVTL